MIELRAISGVGEYRPLGFSPVVVFQDGDGSFRFPGQDSDPTPSGCQRVELRTVSEVRSFERAINRRERAKYQARQEFQDRCFSAQRKSDRSELRSLMQRMTPFGRDFAEIAMRKNDQKSMSSQSTRYDPKFRIEVFSDNESNMHAKGKR